MPSRHLASAGIPVSIINMHRATNLNPLCPLADQPPMGGLTFSQEVLGGLQGHLGSGQAAEISTALEVLLRLTGEHAGQLLQHAHFVAALLDCLDTFSQAQLHQV